MQSILLLGQITDSTTLGEIAFLLSYSLVFRIYIIRRREEGRETRSKVDSKEHISTTVEMWETTGVRAI